MQDSGSPEVTKQIFEFGSLAGICIFLSSSLFFVSSSLSKVVGLATFLFLVTKPLPTAILLEENPFLAFGLNVPDSLDDSLFSSSNSSLLFPPFDLLFSFTLDSPLPFLVVVVGCLLLSIEFSETFSASPLNWTGSGVAFSLLVFILCLLVVLDASFFSRMIEWRKLPKHFEIFESRESSVMSFLSRSFLQTGHMAVHLFFSM